MLSWDWTATGRLECKDRSIAFTSVNGHRFRCVDMRPDTFDRNTPVAHGLRRLLWSQMVLRAGSTSARNTGGCTIQVSGQVVATRQTMQGLAQGQVLLTT